MKYLLTIVLMFGISNVKAAEGSLAYESASSSMTSYTATLSSSAPTLISKTEAQSLMGNGKKVSWYSTTLYNVSASTSVYAFSASSTIAPSPALTCTSVNSVPCGAGTAATPYIRIENFLSGIYMWGMSCKENETLAIKVVLKGR